MSAGEPGALRIQQAPETPKAKLQVISLRGLQDGNAAEAERLFAVSKTSGFFYLDFSDSNGVTNDDIDKVFQLEKSLFKLPQEELLRYDVDQIGRLKLNGCVPHVCRIDPI